MRRRRFLESPNFKRLCLYVTRGIKLWQAIAIEIVQGKHFHPATSFGQQMGFPWRVQIPGGAFVFGAVARILVPVNAVLVPAARDNVGPAIAVEIEDKNAVRADEVARSVIRPKRMRHEVRAFQPIIFVHNVELTIAIQIGDGAISYGAANSMRFENLTVFFSPDWLSAAWPADCQQHHGQRNERRCIDNLMDDSLTSAPARSLHVEIAAARKQT